MTAEELESQLTISHMGFEAKRLFSWTNACGTYLGRLATKRPDRIERKSNSQRREWLIKPELVTP